MLIILSEHFAGGQRIPRDEGQASLSGHGASLWRNLTPASASSDFKGEPSEEEQGKLCVVGPGDHLLPLDLGS